MNQDIQTLKMQYLGLLNFTAELMVHIPGAEGDEARETFGRILDDATKLLPSLGWRQVLDRFELSLDVPTYCVAVTSEAVPDLEAVTNWGQSFPKETWYVGRIDERGDIWTGDCPMEFETREAAEEVAEAYRSRYGVGNVVRVEEIRNAG